VVTYESLERGSVAIGRRGGAEVATRLVVRRLHPIPGEDGPDAERHHSRAAWLASVRKWKVTPGQ
jgi:hypothetical protein